MFELFIAGRYLRAKRKQVVISVITVISVIGVAAGVMALVIALAVIISTPPSGCFFVLSDSRPEHDRELRAMLANLEPVAPRESKDGKHQPVVSRS